MTTYGSVLELGEAVITGAVVRGDTVLVDTAALTAMSPLDLQRLARIIRCTGIGVVPRAGLAYPILLSYSGVAARFAHPQPTVVS